MKRDLPLSVLLTAHVLTTVAIVTMRARGVIDWPWLCVLAPIWIPIALATLAVGILVAVSCAAIALGFTARALDSWRKR